MTELREKLNYIVEEKNTKIFPQNIKKGINIFDVVGEFEGTDTSDATATAEDIRKGKIAYVNGEKIVGTLDKAYRELEYIETTNEGQYIDTGYFPSGISQFEISYSNFAGGGCLFGGYNSSWTDGFGLFAGDPDVSNYWFHYNQNIETSIKTAGDADIVVNRGTFTANGQTYTLSNRYFTVNKPMYIFAGNVGGVIYNYARFRLHKFIIKEADIVLHNFVPAIYIFTGKIGLYDTITDNFFINKGVGSFIGGPEV